MVKESGALSGSRASHRANSTVVSTKGFDPARIAIYAKGCDAIIERLENSEPQYYAETVEQLERRHDSLAEEVRNIAGMVRGLALAIAMDARQGGDGETRLHPKDDSAGRQASPKPSRGTDHG